MIIITIKGGIGNQLFTYATAYALAKKFNEELLLDLKIYQTNYTLRVCQLEEYNIDYTCKIMPHSLGHNIFSICVYRLVHAALLKYRYKVRYVDEKEHFVYQKINVKKGTNICLRGYWQNHRYFDDVRNDLIRQFTPLSLSQEVFNAVRLLTDNNSVAVHIRRTDYKTYKGGKCLNIDYYINSMNLMKARLGYSPNYIVFTDDVDFCKRAFASIANISYIGDIAKLTDIEELYVMSQCDKFIIANSTFSWWAAYLSTKSNKIVYCPVVDFWQDDFYMPDWNKVKATLE